VYLPRKPYDLWKVRFLFLERKWSVQFTTQALETVLRPLSSTCIDNVGFVVDEMAMGRV
jgi:hypothetical protein